MVENCRILHGMTLLFSEYSLLHLPSTECPMALGAVIGSLNRRWHNHSNHMSTNSRRRLGKTSFVRRRKERHQKPNSLIERTSNGFFAWSPIYEDLHASDVNDSIRSGPERPSIRIVDITAPCKGRAAQWFGKRNATDGRNHRHQILWLWAHWAYETIHRFRQGCQCLKRQIVITGRFFPLALTFYVWHCK